jgi:hypothetical protein
VLPVSVSRSRARSWWIARSGLPASWYAANEEGGGGPRMPRA